MPVSTTASYGLVIATKAGSPYKTIKDVIAAAKVRPGTLNFGTINAGSAQNLSAELFRTMSGSTSRSSRTKRHRISPMPCCAATSTSHSNSTRIPVAHQMAR